MLHLINFVVIKDVIYTEKSLTLVVGTRTFLSQMCPFMFRFEGMRIRGRPKSSTRSVERHFSIPLFCQICFPPVSVFFSRFGSLVFQLTSEVWKRVMGHVVRKSDVTACEKQPAPPRSLISAFVVHSLEILVDKLATRTNSAFSS